MNRASYILLVVAGVAMLMTRVPEAAGDCRRVCRAGEARNAERCCVKGKRRSPPAARRPPRVNHATRCVVNKNLASCAREGLRLVRIKQYTRSHDFLATACASSATPVPLMRRSCFTLAKLIKHGQLTKRALGPTQLMSRACAGTTAAECGDKDGDGIQNHLDACPAVKEDVDGFKDDDGCPDLDNDGDRVPDTKDACPHLWGAGKDGCPRFGERIGNSFMFVDKTDKLDYSLPSTRPRLDALVRMLKQSPKLKYLEIRGHASTSEGGVARLSWTRAHAFKRVLVAAGIQGSRLRVNAYASTMYRAPLVDVVVAGALRYALTQKQIAQGIREIKRRADWCQRKPGADGKGTWKFWIRADGTVLANGRSVGALAGSDRGACITTVLRRYRFPKSGASGRTAATLRMKFP